MTQDDTGGPLEPISIGRDGLAMLALSMALMALSLGVSLLLCFGYVLCVAVRARCDADPAPVLLVPGMRLGPDGTPSADFQARLSRAAALSARSPGATIVILGGRTSAGMVSEAAAGRQFLLRRGIAQATVRIEDRSRHTLENLRNYRALATGASEPVLLISSRFHLARCSLLANGLGIRHRIAAAEDRAVPAPRHLALMVFEALLIHWYLTGRIFSRLTRDRRMAARIS